MKRLHVLLGMLVLVAGWWGWVEYRKPREWREPTRGVRGRVVDVFGDPVRGCAVSIEDRDTREVVKSTTTRRDGTFEFETASLQSGLSVVARADGCAAAVRGLWPPVRGIEAMPDLVLVPGASLRGRLIDADGRPRAGVTVRLLALPHQPWNANLPHARLETGADGEFESPEPIDAGWLFVAVDGAQVRPAGVLVLPGRDRVEDFVATEREVDADIRGRVVDDQGKPVPGVECDAMISMESYWRDPIAVDPEGAFVVEHFTGMPRGPITLRASSPGYHDVELGSVQWGARDVELVVRKGPLVRVRVVDAAGAPVPEVWMHIGSARYVVEDASKATDADGWVDLPGAWRDRQVVRLTLHDWLLEATLVEADLADSPPREVVLEVGEGERRLVVVLAGSGVPVAGARLELGLLPAARPGDAPVAAAALYDRCVETDSATTDAAGLAYLVGHPTARYLLRVEAPGRRVFFTECRIGAGAEPLVVDLGAGASVRGTLRPASVVAQLQALDTQATTSIELRRVGDEDWSRVEGSVAADGSFSIRNFETGDWVARLHYVVHGRAVRTEPLAVLAGLRDGEVRDVPIDVSGLAHTRLTGAVTVNGAPHVGAIEIQVERRGADGQTHTVAVRAHTDAGGRFARMLPPGRCRVLAEIGDATGSQAWVPSGFVDAAPGRRAGIGFRVEAVAVDVVTRRADGTPVDAEWRVVDADEWTWNAYLAPGTWRALLAPGRHELSVRRAALRDHAHLRAWVGEHFRRGLGLAQMGLDLPAGELEVPVGQASARVEVVLPEAAGY